MRKVLLPALIIIGASLLLIRVFYLQIIDDSFKLNQKITQLKSNMIIRREVIFMIEMECY